jgi:phosphoribosylamine--glycine ligase
MDNGTLVDTNINFDERSCATIMAVSGGYPGDYEKNKLIIGLETATSKDSIIFHAGTKLAENGILTNGGRVFAISSYGNTISEAVEKSKILMDQISFEGMNYRRDIGYEFQ